MKISRYKKCFFFAVDIAVEESNALRPFYFWFHEKKKLVAVLYLVVIHDARQETRDYCASGRKV